MSDLAKLAKPFPERLIRQRPVGTRQADYVSASTVVEKLLAVVGPFDWEIVDTKSAATKSGEVAGAYVTGRLRLQVDGRTVEVSGIGEGRDLLAAESRALCRAARLVGVGLHLWSGADYSLHRALDRQETDDAT